MRWLRVFAGVPAQVAEVRQFVACLLDGCPAREALVSCASELSANAVIHTASGDGGFFTVEVSYSRAAWRGYRSPTRAARPSPPPGSPSPTGSATTTIDDLPTCTASGSPSSLRPRAAGATPTPASGRTVWAEAAWPVPTS